MLISYSVLSVYVSVTLCIRVQISGFPYHSYLHGDHGQECMVYLIIEEIHFMAYSSLRILFASLCLLPGACSGMLSVQLFPRDFTDAHAVGSRLWKLLPTCFFFFLSLSTSQWADLSVKRGP